MSLQTDMRADADRTHRRYRYKADPDRNISRWPAMILYCKERDGWFLPGGGFTRSQQHAELMAQRIGDLMWKNMGLRPEMFRAVK